MASVKDNRPFQDDEYSQGLTSEAETADWVDTIEADLERELGRRTPLAEKHASSPVADAAGQKPIRVALSAIRDNLDRRTREWRGSAMVVEQCLRALVAAEQARAAALTELAEVEADVARTGQALTSALASFDESDENKNIDPLFAQSEAALDDLNRIANELSVAQHWCRAAWKAYAEALAREQNLRLNIQSAEWAA